MTRCTSTPPLLPLLVWSTILHCLIGGGGGRVHAFGTGWRPLSESQPFRLGDGKAEGVKVKGYEGEWPLWSGLRAAASSSSSSSSSSSAVAPSVPGGTTPVVDVGVPGKAKGKGEGGEATWKCTPAGACQKCPDDARHLPYCRPYGNRQPLVCTSASAPSAGSAATTTIRAYESCGKVVQDEARDFLEFVMSTAVIAVVAITVFVQRQKVLFQRQNQLLSFRVSGTRSGGVGATTTTRSRRAGL
ncbi:uncharacterized protein PFL1_06917 [Pseudozyma flocculosa PF-1]|uniref:Uncharacterized protein n=2 Tax=Pseudozyma flocculosa TaxID=84751 RepID=A0A5C3EV61_9BASI|nr:uncharacterized protein PFL1_06917 [Pseudozyma flocculosa PF-1]EPQ25970.1 hypothetical protein PFL1_06917 [Pseudozyma flocculosa PF-1]SPO35730.1 uncharacterized protein PSFLO_01201 [Pseudozyma flocculosa]